MLSSRDIAYELTLYDWELLNCVHEVTSFILPRILLSSWKMVIFKIKKLWEVNATDDTHRLAEF